MTSVTDWRLLLVYNTWAVAEVQSMDSSAFIYQPLQSGLYLSTSGAQRIPACSFSDFNYQKRQSLPLCFHTFPLRLPPPPQSDSSFPSLISDFKPSHGVFLGFLSSFLYSLRPVFSPVNISTPPKFHWGPLSPPLNGSSPPSCVLYRDCANSSSYITNCIIYLYNFRFNWIKNLVRRASASY